MFHAHYVQSDDPKGHKIKGLYTEDNRVVPKPSITINQETYANLIAEGPENFRVVNGMVKRVAKSTPNPRAGTKILAQGKVKAKITGLLKVGDRNYKMSPSLMSNLSINLAICANVSEHTCLINCIEDGTKVAVEHNKDDLLRLALAFNSRREMLSKNLHQRG